MVEVCLLGCGGMVPLPNRRLTSMLFKYKGRMILIDCGEGTQVAIKLAGLGVKAIEAICITHYHADHVAGLPGFLLTLGNSGRVEPLTIYGPPGLMEVVRGLMVIAPELPFEVKLVEMANESETIVDIGEIIIKSIPVEHWISCMAYSIEIHRAGRFDAKKAKNSDIPMIYWNRLQRGETIEHLGRILRPEMVLGEARRGIKVSYCTDTRPVEGLIPFIKDSDLFICEGMYGEGEKLPKAIENKHMTFEEAANIASRGEVRELWLTHYSPSIEDPSLYIDNARNIFSLTNLGEDLKMKTLIFD